MTHEMNLFTILQKEITPNYNHSKEMHDVCRGQNYCTNWNVDL